MGFEDTVNAAEPWDSSSTCLNQAFTSVRMKYSGQKADDVMVEHYVQLALEQKAVNVPREMSTLKEAMHAGDLNILAGNIFNLWLGNPQPEIQKGVFLLYGLHAKDKDVMRLWRLIMEWLKQNGDAGEYALDGVWALSLSRSEIAPMIVDYINRNAANEKVRKAANEILTPLAQNLGISVSELQDYIVPTLHFDDNGRHTLIVGENRFMAAITPFLTLELMDENGAPLAVPAKSADFNAAETNGAANAEPETAAVDVSDATLPLNMRQALTRFYALEEVLKTVVAVQSQRLRLFMLGGRNWDKGMWRHLFMDHPILRKYSATLVWGVYEDQVLCDTFIFSINDGICTNVNGQTFDFDAIDDKKRINPAHVFEMPASLVAAWRERIAAEGIIQPLRQMEVELSLTLATESDLLSAVVEGCDVRVLKGFDYCDCTEENRFRLESLGRILGVEGKELFMDIYYSGYRCLQERIYYPLTCEAGDPDVDALVEKRLHSPNHKAYPWLIMALERNKTPYWLNRLYAYLKEGLQKREPNAFAARGLLHADLHKYYDIARDTFILCWEENLPNDMGLYAFESNVRDAVKDIVPYLVKITPADTQKAANMSLQGIVQSAYRKLAPEEFYDIFRPVYDNPAARDEFARGLASRVKYYWHKRDLWMELEMEVPVKQLLKLDPRWYEPFLRNGHIDFIVHSVTPNMPVEPMSRIFAQIIERDFTACEDLDAFYKYTLGMMALGCKDFVHDILGRVKTLMSQLPCKPETLQRLAYHMEREATAYGDEFWLQQFILLDPVGFAGVFEAMRETAAVAEQKLIDGILKSIYEIISRK